MDKLFDESILIGSGYTARETLRYGRKVGMSSWVLVMAASFQGLLIFATMSV